MKRSIGDLIAAVLLIVSLVILLVAAVALSRESPAVAGTPIDAIRLGIEEGINCNDAATCAATALMGAVRFPARDLACDAGTSSTELTCTMTLGGRPLVIVAAFRDAEKNQIDACLSATYAGEDIKCQPIYYYPVSEIALGPLPGLAETEISALRSAYPLSQMGSVDWWPAVILLTALAALAVGCCGWLLTRRLPAGRRLVVSAGAALITVCVSGFGLLLLITRLQFPID